MSNCVMNVLGLKLGSFGRLLMTAIIDYIRLEIEARDANECVWTEPAAVVSASLVLTALLTGAALTGCGSPPVYEQEAFLPNTPYRVRFDGSREIVCDSVKRALLGQGYVLESPLETGVLNVSKAFQRDKQTVTLRVQSTCMDNGDGSHTVFASAQEEVSELQPIKQPLGVNVGGFGGITLPSGSARVPVTVKRQTVQDHDFYARLYKQIGQQIDEARRR